MWYLLVIHVPYYGYCLCQDTWICFFRRHVIVYDLLCLSIACFKTSWFSTAPKEARWVQFLKTTTCNVWKSWFFRYSKEFRSWPIKFLVRATLKSYVKILIRKEVVPKVNVGLNTATYKGNKNRTQGSCYRNGLFALNLCSLTLKDFSHASSLPPCLHDNILIRR